MHESANKIGCYLLYELLPDLAALKPEPPMRPPLRAASADITEPNVCNRSKVSKRSKLLCQGQKDCILNKQSRLSGLTRAKARAAMAVDFSMKDVSFCHAETGLGVSSSAQTSGV